MKRTITLLLWVGLLCPLLTLAQQKTITGRVETQNGVPIPVASVQIAGGNEGTVADAGGRFVIQASVGDTLIVSSLSYITRKVVVGSENSIHVSLSPNTQMLQETVVTALGVMQQKRSLGYSTTELQGSEFTKARVTNIGDALSGKVAGVDVAGVSAGPGGSSRVVIRGNGSLGGNNQPLYVIDGVPYDNSNQGMAGQYGGQDLGDQLTGINPDNIASIQVLKSVAASALYGYRGGNGAILITTKSGANSHGIGVEVNNSLQFSRVIDETDYQYEYGQGDNGIKPASLASALATTDSYGAKIDGSPTVNFLGQTVPYVAYKRNFQNFYKTGLQNESTLALTGANDKGHFRLGLSNMLLNGIIPNSGMKQQGINFNSSYDITPKLQLTFFTNYTLENVKNSTNLSDAPANINASINYLPSTFDVRWMKDSLRHLDGSEYLPSSNIFYENPYFMAYEYQQSTHREILTGGITLKYNLFNWLYLQGSATRNGYIYDYNYVIPSGVQYTFSPGTLGGNITQSETNFHELNGNFMAGVNKDFGSNFNLNGFLGANTQDDVNQSFGTSGAAAPFVIPQFYSVNNTVSRPFAYDFSHYRVNSVFGSVTGGYKNYLFLTVTARNDWFSTLNIKTNHYLYPSVSGSFVFSDALHLPSWITFGKLRASYAGASNGTSPYQNILTYGLQSYTISGQSLGYVTNSTIPNANLRPVSITEKEVGLNMQFFNDRLGFDVDYYSKHTTDDIVPVTVSPTSGYTGNLVNVGKIRNNGIEVLLTATPVQSRNFSWDLSFNFADNISKVLDIGVPPTKDNPQPSLIIAGAIPRWGNEVNISNVVGLPYAQIMGYKYQRNAQGKIIIDSASGMPLQTGVVPMGSGVPKYTGGFSNNLRYKNFSLSFLIAYSFGAKIYSGTNLLLYQNGQQKATLQGRANGYVAPGVNQDGKPNSVVVPAQIYWQDLATGADQNAEPFVYNDSYIRVRSASLTYTFPATLLKNRFIKGADISLVTYNPFILLKYVPNIDPETNYTNSNGQGLELAGYPATRSFGLNVDVKF
ncbi:MAG: SusC/RagA family TonB-linked outer membrane protein [Chitinophagaceae bacterium]|nr:MAG: SusC/RagA family TonB-linked outer membrane protein [Chitinophagaceae bacterium]